MRTPLANGQNQAKLSWKCLNGGVSCNSGDFNLPRPFPAKPHRNNPKNPERTINQTPVNRNAAQTRPSPAHTAPPSTQAIIPNVNSHEFRTGSRSAPMNATAIAKMPERQPVRFPYAMNGICRSCHAGPPAQENPNAPAPTPLCARFVRTPSAFAARLSSGSNGIAVAPLTINPMINTHVSSLIRRRKIVSRFMSGSFYFIRFPTASSPAARINIGATTNKPRYNTI